jgi:hypothetical protein
MNLNRRWRVELLDLRFWILASVLLFQLCFAPSVLAQSVDLIIKVAQPLSANNGLRFKWFLQTRNDEPHAADSATENDSPPTNHSFQLM